MNKRHPFFGDVTGWTKRHYVFAYAVSIPLVALILAGGMALYDYLKPH